MKSITRILAITCGLLTVGTVADSFFHSGIMMPQAAAIYGAPWTPVSVAGVARRTTRRMIRRSEIYAASLPTGCIPVVIEGNSLYQCGATYYQPYNNQYVVVYID